MVSHKKIDLEVTILNLLSEKKTISLLVVAEKAGLAPVSLTARRAIQRAFAKLCQRGLIQAQGNARARTYISSVLTQTTDTDEPFAGIPLSDASVELLQYVSKSIRSRKPVGYNQDFINTYDPEKTHYLGQLVREELYNVGKTEIVERAGGTYARHIINRLLIDLSWNSSRLEGNTYSLLETKRLIEMGENAAGKELTEAQMILNHKDAIEYIVELAQEEKVSSHEICSIHALLSDNLLGDPSASGRLRNLAVGISGTTYLPLDNPHVLRDCFAVFIKKFNQIKDPFEQSFFALVHLSYMQAFEDVNKRTARLVANIPLIQRNLNPLSFIDVKQSDYVMSLLGIYEKNDVSLLHDLYVWAYKRSAQRYSAMQQSMGEPNVFKMKHRLLIQIIVRNIILEKIPGPEIVTRLNRLIAAQTLSNEDSEQLLQVIETEIMGLHDGNIARFKIKPSEFQAWVYSQSTQVPLLK